jgi:predicted transcriptional regulator
VEADTPVSEAAERMGKKDIHRMMVVEAGKPVGILSVTDLVAGIAAQEPLRRTTVGDVTSRTFLVCRDDNTVLSAARTMTQAGWRSIVVVDSSGKLKGILTGHQLAHLAGNTVDENLQVKDFINRDLITVDINASVQEAADLLIQHHRHRAVVIDKNEPDHFPLGVISSFDIVAEMARPDSIWQRK